MQTIVLNDEEALSFLKWREHQDVFEALLSHGVFDIRNGSAELHFNRDGILDSIDAHLKLFKHSKVIHTVLIEKKD